MIGNKGKIMFAVLATVFMLSGAMMAVDCEGNANDNSWEISINNKTQPSDIVSKLTENGGTASYENVDGTAKLKLGMDSSGKGVNVETTHQISAVFNGLFHLEIPMEIEIEGSATFTAKGINYPFTFYSDSDEKSPVTIMGKGIGSEVIIRAECSGYGAHCFDTYGNVTFKDIDAKLYTSGNKNIAGVFADAQLSVTNSTVTTYIDAEEYGCGLYAFGNIEIQKSTVTTSFVGTEPMTSDGGVGVRAKNLTIKDSYVVADGGEVAEGKYSEGIVVDGDAITVSSTDADDPSSLIARGHGNGSYGIRFSKATSPTISASKSNLVASGAKSMSISSLDLTTFTDLTVKGVKIGEIEDKTITTNTVNPTEYSKLGIYVKPATVNFVDSGKIVKSTTIDVGDTVERCVLPAKEGYTHTGWYLDGVLFDFDTPITKDCSLVAKWEKNSESGAVVIDAKNTNTVEIDVSETSDLKTVTVNFKTVTLSIRVTDEMKGEALTISAIDKSNDKYEIDTVYDDGALYEGVITITLPYTSSKGVPSAYYYGEDGHKEKMSATVNVEQQTVTFTTTHNSTYGVEYTIESEKSFWDTTGNLAGVIILAALILLLLALIVNYNIKKD